MSKKFIIFIILFIIAILAIVSTFFLLPKLENQTMVQKTFTQTELAELYSSHTGPGLNDGEAFTDMTFEQIIETFNGATPTSETNIDPTSISIFYSYTATDNNQASILFTFEDKNGVLDCVSVSKNFN